MNEIELLKYGRLEKIDDEDWFFEQLTLETPPDKIGELSVFTDIKRHPQLKECYIYILCMAKEGCTIGDYDYTEHEYFMSKEDFNKACDAYKGSVEKCRKRYTEYMNNYHKLLLDETI